MRMARGRVCDEEGGRQRDGQIDSTWSENWSLVPTNPSNERRSAGRRSSVTRFAHLTRRRPAPPARLVRTADPRESDRERAGQTRTWTVCARDDAVARTTLRPRTSLVSEPVDSPAVSSPSIRTFCFFHDGAPLINGATQQEEEEAARGCACRRRRRTKRRIRLTSRGSRRDAERTSDGGGGAEVRASRVVMRATPARGSTSDAEKSARIDTDGEYRKSVYRASASKFIDAFDAN